MNVPDSPVSGDGGRQGVVGSRYNAGSRECPDDLRPITEKRPTACWAPWVWRLAQALLDGDVRNLEGLPSAILHDVVAAANELREETR